MESTLAKISRAKEHLKTLDAEIACLTAKLHPYPVTMEHDPKTGWNDFYAEEVPIDQDTIHIAMVVGDIIHNLRDGLDHLAWDLAKLAGKKKPSRSTQFPIFRDEIEFICKGRPRIAGLRQGDAAIIEALQPYQRQDPPDAHPLAWLNYLSNIDKHQSFIVTAASTETTFIPIIPGILIETAEIFSRILKGRTKIARLRLPDGEPYVNVDADLSVDIVFGDGLVANQPVKTAIDRIGFEVGEVVRRFYSAFPK